jgi:hypothetical protein
MKKPIIPELETQQKYPLFYAEATKTINDIIEHITNERGIYTSNIEPDPRDHIYWLNTNLGILYKYNEENKAFLPIRSGVTQELIDLINSKQDITSTDLKTKSVTIVEAINEIFDKIKSSNLITTDYTFDFIPTQNPFDGAVLIDHIVPGTYKTHAHVTTIFGEEGTPDPLGVTLLTMKYNNNFDYDTPLTFDSLKANKDNILGVYTFGDDITVNEDSVLYLLTVDKSYINYIIETPDPEYMEPKCTVTIKIKNIWIAEKNAIEGITKIEENINNLNDNITEINNDILNLKTPLVDFYDLTSGSNNILLNSSKLTDINIIVYSPIELNINFNDIKRNRVTNYELFLSFGGMFEGNDITLTLPKDKYSYFWENGNVIDIDPNYKYKIDFMVVPVFENDTPTGDYKVICSYKTYTANV